MKPKVPLLHLVLLAAAAPASAGGVEILTPGGGMWFPEVRDAVDAAVEGDAILVAEGQYEPFTIDGKSLSIFAVPGAKVRFDRTLRVENLAAHQTVVLSGFEVQPNHGGVWCVSLRDNEGHVRLQDCLLRRPMQVNYAWDCSFGDPPPGVAALSAERCSKVALVDCTLLGGAGTSTGDYWGLGCDGGTGGPGLEATDCHVALYRCSLTGGTGGNTTYYGTGMGGLGLRAVDSTVFASGAEIFGGSGAVSYEGAVGPGGDGVWLAEDARLFSLDGVIAGGSTGGIALTGPGEFRPVEGVARAIEGPSVASSAEPLDALYVGAPGDLVWVPASTAFDHVFAPKLRGVWLTESPPAPWLQPFDRAGALGEVLLAVDLPAPSVGGVHATVTLQGLAARGAYSSILGAATPLGPARDREPIGLVVDRRLASARHVLVLDPLVGPDCNGNGVSDYLELALEPGVDLNHDLLLDECVPPPPGSPVR